MVTVYWLKEHYYNPLEPISIIWTLHLAGVRDHFNYFSLKLSPLCKKQKRDTTNSKSSY